MLIQFLVCIIFFLNACAEFPSCPRPVSFQPQQFQSKDYNKPLTAAVGIGSLVYQTVRAKKGKSFDRFSKKDFKKYFKKCTDQQILTQFELYQYASFRSFIKKLPTTNNFIAQLANRLDNASWFTKDLVSNARFHAALDADFPGIDIDTLKRAVQSYYADFKPVPLLVVPSPPPSNPINDSFAPIKEAVTQEQKKVASFCQAQEFYLAKLCTTDKNIERYTKRYKALKILENNQQTWRIEKYSLSIEATRLINQQQKSIDQFTSCYGTEIQQVLHKEFITITENISRQILSQPLPQQNAFLLNIFDFAEAGLYSNHAGHIGCALDWAEIAWNCLDYLNAVVEGAIEGIIKTGTDLKESITHPLETAHSICDSLATTAALLAKMCMAQSRLHLTWAINPLAFPNQAAEEFEPLVRLAAVIAEKVTEMPPRKLVKETTAVITNAFLLQVGLGALNKFFTFATKNIPKYVQTVTQRLETVPQLAALEAAPVLLAEQTANNVEMIATTLQGVESSAQEAALEHAVQVLEQASHEQCLIIHQLQKLFQNLYEELPILEALNKQRKGFAEFANKCIKFPLAHIFTIEFKLGKDGISLSGFHHDPMNIIEKSGILKFANKKFGKNGIYKAKVFFNGNEYNKTFFPTDWSREKVISKIYEAYDDFISNGANATVTKGGQYKISGLTSEGIEIEMYITKKGRVTTVYPTSRQIE